jgi:signal transduction histidine kinase
VEPPRPPEHRLRYIDLGYIITGVLGFFLALLLSYYLSNRISRPLSQLTEAAQHIAAGAYGREVEVSGYQEVERLGAAFNTLSQNLSRNETLRKNMIADISHELRTPLAAQRGYLEALEDGVIPFDRESLGVLSRNNLLLSRLVEDLRQLALADAGQLELHPQPLDIGKALRETVAGFEHDIQEKDVRVDFALSHDLPSVKADPERLSQVVGNLVQNALAYSPRGGSILLEARRDGEEVVVSVSDRGPGIEKAELPLIFERFHRVDRSRARESGGSGLGLSIARSLVEAHGGRMWAESEPGEGTTVSFTLPRA